MLEHGIEDLLARERPHVIAEELRLLLRRRDQISLEAARLAGELARVGYGEAMGSISTPDWIRHECHLGYQAAADLVFVGLEMDSLAASVAAAARQPPAGRQRDSERHSRSGRRSRRQGRPGAPGQAGRP